MKKLLLTSIAALLLATGAAHATGDFCAVVLKPPPEVRRDKEFKDDAWLVIRDGPGKQFLRMGKLGTGDFLRTETHCDVHDCDDGKWTHIMGIPRYDGPPESRSHSRGWVRSKYIQEFPCPEDQAEDARRDPNAIVTPGTLPGYSSGK